MSSRILIVDDEPDMRTLLRLSLRGAGYDLEEASTGEEAIAALDTETFDLVLLDLNLPGISGMEVLERWKRDGVIDRVAVLMLTADARPGLEGEAAELGACGFLTKPIPPRDLIAEIERALGLDLPSTATVEGT